MAARQSVDNANDWDHHWDVYGTAFEDIPANLYRRNMILKLLGRPPTGSTVLDIGSGQGEFALHYQRAFPDLLVSGVEYSSAGVERARAHAAKEGSAVRFWQADLLTPTELPPGQQPATFAICSEVLEHVEDPTTLIRNARALLAPACRLVVTVPGGPRSALDHHIGHYQHFTAAKLHNVLTDAGYIVERTVRTGFPVFNLYKLVVIARGKRLISDVEGRTASTTVGTVESVTKAFFRLAFRHCLDDFPFGWQIAAVATVPRDSTGPA
jgi:2-polyprenyl-3-methyl-5-hydroxy-6-metoxy-1,4-benzoquinol methylase